MGDIKPTFIKIKQINGIEKWINPWNISTIYNRLSRIVLKMTNDEIIEFDYNEKENEQLLNYMQSWAPLKKEIL